MFGLEMKLGFKASVVGSCRGQASSSTSQNIVLEKDIPCCASKNKEISTARTSSSVDSLVVDRSDDTGGIRLKMSHAWGYRCDLLHNITVTST